MSNFPLSYKLSWLPRLLKPSLRDGADLAAASLGGTLLQRPPRKVVRLVFLGDISAVANNGAPFVDPAIRDTIASGDLVIGNCESPVVARPSAPFRTMLGTHHAMTPAFLDAVIEVAGIDPRRLVLSLANNHALDQGVDGFEQTLAVLAERAIRVVGTVAGGPLLRLNAGPLGLGLVAFTQWRNADQASYSGRVAMLPDVAGWRESAGGVDLVCAIPHWDREFRHFPELGTRTIARNLVAEGAALIVGHHAHVLQPAERIGDAVVAYGLGDFLGTAAAHAPWPIRIGAVFSAEVSADDATRGRVAAWRLHPFLRGREGGRERLVPIDRAEGRVGRFARARLAAIFAGAP